MRRPNAHSGQWLAALGVCVVALLLARRADAKVYAEWQPRVTVGAGYDDNILLDKSGGDSFGQVLPGLKLNLFGDHGMRTVADCQVGLSRLMQPEAFPRAGGDFVLNQACGLEYRSRLGTRSALRFHVREQYARDPFSIANQGLLLRPGQLQIFNGKLRSEYSYRASQYGTWLIGLDSDTLFFTAGDPGNGLMVTPSATYERRFSPRDAWSLGLREQLFFALGTPAAGSAAAAAPTWGMNSTGVGSSALGGYRHRFNHVTQLEVKAGPALLARPVGTTLLPVARADLEAATPTSGLHVTLMHDLVLGPHLGGPLVGDLAELGVSAQLVKSLTGHLRGGLYRNMPIDAVAGGVVGYSAGAGVDWKLNRAWVLGASVGRESRLGGDAADHMVDRNIVQMRLTWERPRDW